MVGCFAILPLPHIAESLEFIDYATSLSTPPEGFGVATAMGQHYLGDPAFEPVWAKLNEIGSVLFVHPSDTVMPPNLNFGPCNVTCLIFNGSNG